MFSFCSLGNIKSNGFHVHPCGIDQSCGLVRQNSAFADAAGRDCAAAVAGLGDLGQFLLPLVAYIAVPLWAAVTTAAESGHNLQLALPGLALIIAWGKPSVIGGFERHCFKWWPIGAKELHFTTPKSSRPLSWKIYEVGSPKQPTQFAAGEVSNRIWSIGSNNSMAEVGEHIIVTPMPKRHAAPNPPGWP